MSLSLKAFTASSIAWRQSLTSIIRLFLLPRSKDSVCVETRQPISLSSCGETGGNILSVRIMEIWVIFSGVYVLDSPLFLWQNGSLGRGSFFVLTFLKFVENCKNIEYNTDDILYEHKGGKLKKCTIYMQIYMCT